MDDLGERKRRDRASQRLVAVPPDEAGDFVPRRVDDRASALEFPSAVGAIGLREDRSRDRGGFTSGGDDNGGAAFCDRGYVLFATMIAASIQAGP